MAARPGEDTAAVLFADIHYYYGPPTAKPPHHRFDKGSYVYLFENAAHRRARIEIANSAGTPDQDAFNGYLDSTHIQYSYKHSTLVTVVVEGPNGRPTAPADPQEWHLATYDPRNENKYMYKLHTVDIYFWTKEDAIQFVNGVRRVLPQQQVTVQDEPVPPPPHQDAISPVVQKLENVAITDPSYQHGQTRDSRTTTTTFPGPPISATPQSQESTNFVPMAYNPAAPAAPEAIQHREKTPPPEDGNANPLLAAAASDQGQSFGPPPQQFGFSGPPAQQSYFNAPPPPPASAPAPAPQFSPPPQPPAVQSPFAQHFQHSFAPPPTAPTASTPYAAPPSSVTPTPSAPPPPAYQQQAPNHIPVTQFANYPVSPGITRAMTSPGMYSPGYSSTGTTPSIYSPGVPPAPPGGFSQFNYNNNKTSSVSNTQPIATDYSIHQQVYRPTEHESAPKAGKAVKPPRGKLEERADRLEKGMGSLFKKLEKKIG